MTEKIFIEKKCTDIYEYVGECPKCQIYQQNKYEQNVNVLCKNCCIDSIESIIPNNQLENPDIGSIVFDITKLKTQTRSYSHITLITPSMEIMIIEADDVYKLSEDIPHLIKRYEPTDKKPIDDEKTRDSILTKLWKKLLNIN